MPAEEPSRHSIPPDRLNEIGVLTRREIEARILAPVVEALGEEYGHERVIEIVRQAIIRVAQEQGTLLSASVGGCSLTQFAASLDAWKKGDALQMDVLDQTPDRFSFNVTRCRYAEMYLALGIPELGSVLSCNRDYALVEGFNPEIALTRTQTIMQGAAFCDFRYHMKKG